MFIWPILPDQSPLLWKFKIETQVSNEGQTTWINRFSLAFSLVWSLPHDQLAVLSSPGHLLRDMLPSVEKQSYINHKSIQFPIDTGTSNSDLRLSTIDVPAEDSRLHHSDRWSYLKQS